MRPKNNFIDIKNLSFFYEPGRPAIENLNLNIGEGEFVCILGPSGCGKSTLMSILSGLTPPSSGEVTVKGKNLFENGVAVNLPEMGYVFQDHRLLPWRTVRENIILVLKAAGVPSERWDNIIRDLLEMLQISQFENTYPLNLSGGQRQRVSIARALSIDPSFILMDEPFSTLDEVTARFMRGELLDIWKRTKKTILFVTHSIREAIYLADRIFIMTKGPGRVFKVFPVDVPRPRSYEDVRLAEIESKLVNEILEVWGFEVNYKKDVTSSSDNVNVAG